MSPIIVNGKDQVLDILDKHFHSQNKPYGLDGSTGNLGFNSTVPMVVTGGNNTFGTEVLLNKGSFGGSYYDLSSLQVVAVTAAPSVTILEFCSYVAGAQVAYTMEADDETVTAAGHGLVDGDRVIFDTIAPDDTHGVTRAIVYYVRDMSGSTFKVALTSGGSAVAIDADLSGYIRKMSTNTLEGAKIVNCAATTADALPISLPVRRVASSKYLSVRACSESGDTTGVSFFLNVHAN